MKLIKEAFRMQQLAGLINENYVDLGAINSPFMESEEMNEGKEGKVDTKKSFFKNALKKAYENGTIDKLVKMLDDEYSISFDLSQEELSSQEDPEAHIDSEVDFSDWSAVDVDQDLENDVNQIIKPFKEAKEDDDMDDLESDEEELDYFSNKPGKKDEFDTDDDIEPAAKDVTAGDDLAKLTGSKQAKINALTKMKDKLFATFKADVKGLDLDSAEFKAAVADYKNKLGDIPKQIKKLQADIDRDLSIDDEEEI